MYERSNETQKENNTAKQSFIKSLLQAAVEEVKSISKGAVAMVLVCAIISVLGISLFASNAENQQLANDKAGLSDKLSEKNEQINKMDNVYSQHNCVLIKQASSVPKPQQQTVTHRNPGEGRRMNDTPDPEGYYPGSDGQAKSAWFPMRQAD